ncbi:MAG TPA: hypothetical protein ENN03_02875 [bacterium]|nr:hypothetical protein [bacterium]
MSGRAGILDLGTHSLLLLVAEPGENHSVRVLFENRYAVGLGRNLRRNRRISGSAAARALSALNRAKKDARQWEPLDWILVGTQVFREAENRNELFEAIRSGPGLSVEVLSEQEEAFWSFSGVNTGCKAPKGVLDIGGGSTEWAWGNSAKLQDSISIPAGASVLTDQWLAHDPPAAEEIERLQKEVRALIEAAKSPPPVSWTGVGGTLTTLAALKIGLKRYAANAVEGTELSRHEVGRAVRQLGLLSLEERRQRLSVEPDRAEIILAGGVILLTWMETLGVNTIRVSHRGLRHGIALRHFSSSPRKRGFRLKDQTRGWRPNQ